MKRKKIFVDNKSKIIDLFYVKNDIYFSIIYHPTEPWWEPYENSSSHESVSLTSNENEDSGLVLLLRTSLQSHGEMYKIVKNIENKHFRDNELTNRSKLNK
jgi:hypothetical protein